MCPILLHVTVNCCCHCFGIQLNREPKLSDFYKPSDEMKEYQILFIGTVGVSPSYFIYKLVSRNTCMQQLLTHPSNISLKNPSNIDNFSKLSKRQILHSIWTLTNSVDHVNIETLLRDTPKHAWAWLFCF